MSERRLFGAICASIAFGAALPAPAQNGEGRALTGSATLGVRGVEVDGTETKYREDINLEDGARLFNLSLRYAPTDGDSAVDELVFDARNLGGDPFETIHFGVRRYGAFDLKLDRRRSAYFYEDTILPVPLASVTASNAGDFHHFDFERVRDTAALEIDLSPQTRLSFGLEHQTREGESTTTLDIQRDEFEFDKPLDETLDALRFGVEHRFERLTLVFEEELSTFGNTSEIFLPGASPGQSQTNPAALQFFTLDQTYDYDSKSHSLRLLADPTERLNIRGMIRSERLDLDSRAAESSAGTTFGGAPFTTELTGAGEADRDIDFAQIEFGLRIGERTRVVGTTRSNRLDQLGQLAFGGEPGSGSWEIDTTGVEIGIERGLTQTLQLTGGWSHESRDAALRQRSEDDIHDAAEDTDRDGYFLRLLYSATGGLELTASIEDNSIDDPFTLASPTDSRRYRLSARKFWPSGFGMMANYRRMDVDNDASGWAADTEQTDVRISYRTSVVEVSAGLGNVDVERSVDQLVTGGTRQELFPIAYAADSDFQDLSVQWSINDRASLGGRFRDYQNRGSFSRDRDDRQLSFAYRMTDEYTLQLLYRDVDYVEDAYDAYDSRIIELGIRLNWQ